MILWLKAAFNEICDYSGVDFVRHLVIDQDAQEILRFSLNPEDDIYPINSRDNTIDLLEPITQLIRLYEPVSKIAPWYEFNESDEDENFATDNKVIFR